MDKYKKQNRLSIALAFRGMRQSELCEKTGIKKDLYRQSLPLTDKSLAVSRTDRGNTSP